MANSNINRPTNNSSYAYTTLDNINGNNNTELYGNFMNNISNISHTSSHITDTSSHLCMSNEYYRNSSRQNHIIANTNYS